jgi:hypothetical protein
LNRFFGSTNKHNGKSIRSIEEQWATCSRNDPVDWPLLIYFSQGLVLAMNRKMFSILLNCTSPQTENHRNPAGVN